MLRPTNEQPLKDLWYHAPLSHSPGVVLLLPARLLNAGNQAVRSHLTELDTADTELTHITLWTTGDHTTVVLTDRIRVAWQL